MNETVILQAFPSHIHCFVPQCSPLSISAHVLRKLQYTKKFLMKFLFTIISLLLQKFYTTKICRYTGVYDILI